MLDNVSGLAARDSAEIGDNKVVGGSIVENRERRGRVCNKGRTSADLMHNANTRRTSFLCTTLSARALQQRRLVDRLCDAVETNCPVEWCKLASSSAAPNTSSSADYSH